MSWTTRWLHLYWGYLGFVFVPFLCLTKVFASMWLWLASMLVKFRDLPFKHQFDASGHVFPSRCTWMYLDWKSRTLTRNYRLPTCNLKPTQITVYGHKLSHFRPLIQTPSMSATLWSDAYIKAMESTSAHSRSSINPLRPTEAAFSYTVGRQGWHPWGGNTNSV